MSRSIKVAASFTPLLDTASTTSTPARDTASKSYAPFNDRGVYTEGLPEYKGKDVFTANPIVVKLLGDRGALLGHHNYKHSYPHCWRCHNPVIFRATEQWFIRMDAASNDTKQDSARSDALENPRREMDSVLGRRPHVRNDRRAARTGAFRASASGACRSSFSTAKAATSGWKISPRFATS